MARAKVKTTGIDVGTVRTFVRSAVAGWIPCDGKSMGKVAGNYQGADYFELYGFLWTLPGLVTTAGYPFKISSAKGASALLDWDAGKTITVDFVTNEVFVRAGLGGTYQADQNKSHSHTATGSNTQSSSIASSGGHTHPIYNNDLGSAGGGGTSGTVPDTWTGGSVTGTNLLEGTWAAASGNGFDSNHTHTIPSLTVNAPTINADGAAENRPKNVALYYHIKY